MKACPSIAAIQRGVAGHYGVRLLDLHSARRDQRVIWPRHVAMFLCRELTAHSLPAIGRQFGRRDHTSIMYALRRVAQRMAREPEEAEAIRALARKLAARAAPRRVEAGRDEALAELTRLLARRKAILAELEGLDEKLDGLGLAVWGAPEGASEDREAGGA